jgi:oligopeptide transport system ATP-binding protein
VADGRAVVVTVEGLSKTFHGRVSLLNRTARATRAVRDVSFEILGGGALGIVGESGSGKTTIARMLVGLEQPSAGLIRIGDEEIHPRISRRQRRRLARQLQIVFQDPYTSLDPRQRVSETLNEVQRVHFSRSKTRRYAKTQELLEAVGLGSKEARALPRELSGGQRQRVAIARALAAEPRVLVLDEAVSALDVSIQAQILNLLSDLRDEFELAYVLISHDLAVIRQIADTVLVMYRGRAVEMGLATQILREPQHPYTQRLLQSVPRPDMLLKRRTAVIESDDDGCVFRQRCPAAFDRCIEEPELLFIDPGHRARCWLVDASAGEKPASAATDMVR